MTISRYDFLERKKLVKSIPEEAITEYKAIKAFTRHIPQGIPREITVEEVYWNDAQYIIDNNITVTFEHVAPSTVGIYLEDGTLDEDGNPFTVLVLPEKGEETPETFKRCVEQITNKKKPKSGRVSDDLVRAMAEKSAKLRGE